MPPRCGGDSSIATGVGTHDACTSKIWLRGLGANSEVSCALAQVRIKRPQVAHVIARGAGARPAERRAARPSRNLARTHAGWAEPARTPSPCRRLPPGGPAARVINGDVTVDNFSTNESRQCSQRRSKGFEAVIKRITRALWVNNRLAKQRAR